METYTVRVTKDYLVFCAAHFISYENTQCERVHGHNYRVAAEVTAPLDDDFLVVDFISMKRILREITNELDHRVLLASENPILALEHSETHVTVRYLDRKYWVFPREDCCILPIANTTAELIAKWIAGRLEDELEKAGVGAFRRLGVEVEESVGQSAIYEISHDG